MSDADIVITGMACVFPGAGDLAQFWRNVRDGIDGISDMPESGWDRVFYDPSSKASDRIPCRRGGFIDAQARFDPLRHGVMPAAARGAEPDQLLALDAATRALEDAGYGRRPPPNRCGVIIGRATIIGPGHARLSQHIRFSEQLVYALRELLPDVAPAELERVKSEFQKKTSAASTDSVIGLVPNLLASRIANRFDFSGPAYTLDAACASSLVAVDQACSELRAGRADLMICGGVHICRDEAFWSVFAQLGALSVSRQIRPFDERADGLLIGEGLGLLVLKRKVDALRDGDRIYAVISGSGTSSDGRGASLVSPRVEGQLRALELAWQASGLDPTEVGLLEAHGTGTPTGDAVEVETLGRFFGPPRGQTAALGSVKSMIGHTMPAAGAAGLIKTVLAVYHGIKPPTLHCDRPREDLAATMFRAQQAPEAWQAMRRIGAVNAFGFGGVNAHVVVESLPAERAHGRARSHAPRGGSLTEPALFAACSVEALLAALDEDRRGGTGPVRLAVLDPTPERLARARKIVERGRRVQGALDISFSPQGLLHEGGKLAFLFPGFDAQLEPRVDDLVDADDGPQPDFSALDMVTRAKAILWLNGFMDRWLRKLGIAPEVVAGHSLGDMSAMTTAGMLRRDEVLQLLEHMRPGSVALADAVYVAAGCSAERARQVIASLPGAVLSHDNCLHQSIVCLTEAQLGAALEAFASAGIVAAALPFRSGMHTPYFEPYLQGHAELARAASFQAPSCTVYSATTAAPYPSDLESARQIVIDHLIKPVQFRALIERMHSDGVRVFVQAGAGALAQFVGDTLRGLPHLAIAANTASSSGRAQLLRVMCSLWVEGAAPRFELLLPRDAPRKDASILLSLGVPMVHFERPLRLAAPIAQAPSGAGDRPWKRTFDDNIARIALAQRDVVAAAAPSAAFTTVVRRAIGLEACYGLADHAFHKMPVGWKDPLDVKAVMPLTGLISLMVEAVEEVLPGRYAIEVNDVVALRWLGGAEAFELEIRCTFDGRDRVEVELVSFAKGSVRVASAYPVRPAFTPRPLQRERPCAIEAHHLYAERMMFHGPAYQGVIELGPLGDDGLRGRLRSLPARGALLDSAAQVLGYWVMQHVRIDRLTIPASVESVRLFGPHPPPGQELECLAEVSAIDERLVRGKLTLAEATGVWAEVDGWIDRRVPCDERLWEVIRFPERHLLSDTPERGLAVFNDSYRDVLTRDYLAGQYLVARERLELANEAPRERRAWLSARIAARDAVRHLLWAHGEGDAFPIEVALEPLGTSAFRATLRERGPIWVAIDRMGDASVALASFSEPVRVHLGSQEVSAGSTMPARLVHGDLTIGWMR